VWEREPARRRPVLSREAIVQAALAVADAEGLEAVSMRRVAAELGARTMSLYTYIERKEDLLDLMADAVAGEVVHPGELPADWRAATIAIVVRERDASRRHPWIIDLVARRSAVGRVGPNAIRHLEQTLQALRGLGLGQLETRRVAAAIADYSTGFVVREAREEHGGDTEAVRDYFAKVLNSGEYPHSAWLAEAGLPPMDDNLVRGLTWLLDGIERDLQSMSAE
jgi:AcrR family transcriptional regulator